MGLDDIHNTGLRLGLGIGCLVKQENLSRSDYQQQKKNLFLEHDQFLPFLSLGPSISKHGDSTDLHQRQASSLSPSAVSSFSNSSVKRERDFGSEEVELERVSSRVSDESEEVELERVSSRVSDEGEEGSPSKKLRLSKEQSAILEDNFKEHSTLNPKQKQALAEQLNLRPRQVEVWFQNRRAKTKLKQTEVDCELLKKCCETLTEENKKLHRELQELKSLKLTASYYMQVPAATLTMCPSCEKVDNGNETIQAVRYRAFSQFDRNVTSSILSLTHMQPARHAEAIERC